jgi:hypothetical protein
MPNKYDKLSEIGYTGLSVWGGQVYDDFLQEMRGLQGIKRYNEMRYNSPIVAALLSAIEQSVRTCSWTVESDDGEDDERIGFIQENMDKMSVSWNDHISEALSMLPFGWSYFEVIYERRGGQVYWNKFSIRGQDTLTKWKFNEAGSIEGMYQFNAIKGQEVFIPIEKSILYRTRVERNNPEGRSILRSCWIPYYYLKNIMTIEGIGIERDLAGMPVIKLPDGASTDTASTSDASVAQKMVRNVRNDEQAGIVLPFGWDFALVSTGGSRQFDTSAIVSRYENRILTSALAQFLLLGQNGVGSLALSKDQSDFFSMSVNTTADIIAETLTRHVIPKLLALNGMDTEGINLSHSPAGDADITKLADFLQKTSSLFTWTAQDETWLRSLAKMPKVDVEEIEAQKEEKRLADEAMQKAIMEKAKPKEEESQDEENVEEIPGVEKEQVTRFTAGRPPNDDERRRWEKRLQKLVKVYFAEEKKRVMGAAKRTKNG